MGRVIPCTKQTTPVSQQNGDLSSQKIFLKEKSTKQQQTKKPQTNSHTVFKKLGGNS